MCFHSFLLHLRYYRVFVRCVCMNECTQNAIHVMKQMMIFSSLSLSIYILLYLSIGTIPFDSPSKSLLWCNNRYLLPSEACFCLTQLVGWSVGLVGMHSQLISSSVRNQILCFIYPFGIWFALIKWPHLTLSTCVVTLAFYLSFSLLYRAMTQKAIHTIWYICKILHFQQNPDKFHTYRYFVAHDDARFKVTRYITCL